MINKDAFDDVVMEQITTEEMVKKKHAEMMTPEPMGLSIYRLPLVFRNLIADENLRTVALCAPVIATGLFYNSYGGKWVDWVIDVVVIKSLLNPALCKLLARVLASKWIKSVSNRACSNIWKQSKKILPRSAVAKLELYAQKYMIHHHLCQIAAVMLQNAPLIFLNHTITMGNMRGSLVNLLENRYMPDIKTELIEPHLPDSEQSKLVSEYRDRPSNTYKLVNLQMQQMQRQVQKDSVRLGRVRLWSISNEDAFNKLSADDRSLMSIAMGEGVHPNGITFEDVINFRARAGSTLANAEWRLLDSENTYIDRITKLNGDITDKTILLKAVMQAELEMVEKYGISLDQLRNMKTVWSEDIVKEFSKMYQLDHTSTTRINFQTARLSIAYADLDEIEIVELPNISETPDSLSMRQFTTRIYNGGSFDTQDLSVDEFQKWQRDVKVSGDYKRWEGLVKWHNWMLDIDSQNARILSSMTPTKTPTQIQQQPLPSGEVIDTTHVTTSNVGDTLGAVSASSDPIIPITAKNLQQQQQALFTSIGETVISSSMRQAVSYTTNNKLGNIRELVHIMYFGGLDAVIRILSGIDGGPEVNPPIIQSSVPNISDELDKMSPQGLTECLTYTGKWHLNDDGVVVDESGAKVNEKCIMRPVIGEAIRFTSGVVLNLISFVANSYLGSGMFSKIARTTGGNLGPAALRKVFIEMCAKRATKLGCGLSTVPIPSVESRDHDRWVMCHFNNVLLNFLCAYSSGGQIGSVLLSTKQNCDKVAIYADVRELGLNAQGLTSAAIDLTADMVNISKRVDQIGSTWRSYLSIPGLLGQIVTKLGSAVFNNTESLWPLIAGSQDISTVRFSYEQIQRELRSNDIKNLLYHWYTMNDE